MNNGHTITVEEVREWVKAKKPYVLHQQDEGKAFYVASSGTLDVVVRGRLIYEGKDIEQAVKAYNEGRA